MTEPQATPETTPAIADFLAAMPDGMGALNDKMGVELVEVSAERVVATIGLVLVSLTVVTFLALEGPASGRELMLSGAAYILVHAGVIVWLWKSRRRPAA